MGGSREGAGGPDPPKNHKNIGFPSNIENHKATKPAFNGGPLSARQRKAILMAFRLRADDGPLIVEFRSSLYPLKKTKKTSYWTPSDKIFWIRAWFESFKLTNRATIFREAKRLICNFNCVWFSKKMYLDGL